MNVTNLWISLLTVSYFKSTIAFVNYPKILENTTKKEKTNISTGLSNSSEWKTINLHMLIPFLIVASTLKCNIILVKKILSCITI